MLGWWMVTKNKRLLQQKSLWVASGQQHWLGFLPSYTFVSGRKMNLVHLCYCTSIANSLNVFQLPLAVRERKLYIFKKYLISNAKNFANFCTFYTQCL